MDLKRESHLAIAVLIATALAGLGVPYASAGPLLPQAQQASAPATRPVGVVKTIQGNTVTLTTDSGNEITVTIPESARVVRAVPGQKDLKDAPPLHLQDIQVGDRMLVLGRPATDGKSITASSAIIMKAADVAARQEQEREDWQKCGVSGLVSGVDATAGTITISTAGAPGGPKKNVLVQVSKSTILRRYSPDSVKFDDAKPSTFDQVKPGDQLRARGLRSADGNEIAAEEIVTGAFRNIAGTINSVDNSTNTINVMDLATKKPVSIKITADSQIKNIPPMFAQRLAARLKGGAPEGQTGAAAAGGHPPSGGNPSGSAMAGPGGSRSGGPPDLQQMLSRLPTETLADLQKGEAVMMVATQGTAGSDPTAITLLTGVEPILTASPSGAGAAMLLSPWNLSPSMGEGTAP